MVVVVIDDDVVLAVVVVGVGVGAAPAVFFLGFVVAENRQIGEGFHVVFTARGAKNIVTTNVFGGLEA